MVGTNRDFGNRMGVSNVASNRTVSSSVYDQKMSRGGFVKTLGVGMAGLGMVATGFSGVARAQSLPACDPTYVTQLGTTWFVSACNIDPNGTTDYLNIQCAFDAAKAWKLANPADEVIVHLNAGQYYVNTNIIGSGFSMTLEGEGLDSTIVKAVRKGPNLGQGFDGSYKYLFFNRSRIAPTVFGFEHPNDNVIYNLTIKGLTVSVEDNYPCDTYTNPSGYATTAMFNLICDWSGNCKTIMDHVGLIGNDGDWLGEYFPAQVKGKNVFIAMHTMRGIRGVRQGIGDATFTYCNAENACWGLVAMCIKDSSILMQHCTVNKCMFGFAPDWANGPVNISGNYAYNCETDGLDLTDLGQVTAVGNYVTLSSRIGPGENKPYAGIWLAGVTNANISGNTIIGGNNAQAAGVWLSYGSNGNTVQNNDYSQSTFSGWTDANPNGPGSVLLSQNSNNNLVYEYKFPPTLAGDAPTVCQQVMGIQGNYVSSDYPDGTRFGVNAGICGANYNAIQNALYNGPLGENMLNMQLRVSARRMR